MKRLITAITLIISFISTAQVDLLTEAEWSLVLLRIDNETILHPNNDEVSDIQLNMTQDNDPLTEDFITNVCNVLTSADGVVTYDENTQTFALPELTQTLISCNEAENSVFEEAYFNFYYDNQNTPFVFSIVGLGDTYFLDVIAPNGDFAQYRDGLFSIEDSAVDLFTIYPNPVENLLTINSQETIENVIIYAITGQKISHQKTNTINTAHLEKGVYFIEVFANNKQSIKRFIKN